MIIDASHRRWIIACLAILAVATVGYVAYARSTIDGPKAGSWPGLAFGIAGLALMLYAGLLGIRRKFPTWRLGRGSTWMKGHLWLGLLSFPLVWFHAGFHLGGPLTLVMMGLFVLVVLSGIFGIVVQQFLPRMMTAQVPYETVYEQIDSVVAQLAADAATVVSSVCGTPPTAVPQVAGAQRGGGGLPAGQFSPRPTPRPVVRTAELAPGGSLLQEVYASDIRPFLQPVMPRDGRLGTPARASVLFQSLRTSLAQPFHEAVNDLEEICQERRQLALQKRLHHCLHGWLLVHVPLSAALLVLSVVHAVVALRY